MNISLPDFLIIGAAKCGTTSLYRTLLLHENIVGPEAKELQYFSSDYKFHTFDINWYKSLFPEKEVHQLLCEASPQYCAEEYLRRIKTTYQDKKLKLIYIIRNPVDRFISQYSHFRAKNIILNNEELFDKVKKGPYQAGNWDMNRWKRETTLFKELALNTNATNDYYHRGLYLPIIKEVDKLFGKSNLHLIIFEDLITDYQNELNKVFNFLNIERQPIKLEHANKRETWSDLADVSGEIDDASVNIVREFYKPHNEKLYEYLGRDLKW